jgi:hypothetical protein
MHSMNVTLGGFEMELALNFGAARELSQKVGDPLGIAREAALEAMMSQAGIVHQPKWVPTVENVPMVLWIGAKHAGSDVKLERVQQAVFEHGFLESKAVALDYIACLVTPSARERSEAGSKADAGE